MAADNKLKKELDFQYRATFFKQTAIGMLDGSITTHNIARLQNVKNLFANDPCKSSIEIEKLINKLRIYYESHTPIESLNLRFRELRLISYNIPHNDFKFCKYILSILMYKWYSTYTSGLVHCLLKYWNGYESDVKTIIKDTLTKYINSSPYAALLPYLSDNGAYQLGYKLYKENCKIYDCCRNFNLSSNRISYSYFTGVLKGYYETAKNIDFTELEKVLTSHNNTIADKFILSRLIVNQYSKANIPYQLFNLALSRIGDPYIDSMWAIPNSATKEETDIIKSAKRIMIQIISSKVINIFFNSLCNDNDRLEFWLKHTAEIQDFKVYGSVYSQNVILSRLDNTIVKTKLNVVGGKSDNCALVMYIDNFVIVEFSAVGALYVYQKGTDYYNRTFNKRIEKIDDLKQPYMPQLINSTYDYLYMNSEGKMVHSGNWRYRLGLWFQKKVDK